MYIYLTSVRDVTWMSANGLHLCKWTVALIQVTLSHLNKCYITHIKGMFGGKTMIFGHVGCLCTDKQYSLMLYWANDQTDMTAERMYLANPTLYLRRIVLINYMFCGQKLTASSGLFQAMFLHAQLNWEKKGKQEIFCLSRDIIQGSGTLLTMLHKENTANVGQL